MNILVIVDKFFPVSETFIYNHIMSLKDHNVCIVGRKNENLDRFPLPLHYKVTTLYDELKFRLAHKIWNAEYHFNPYLKNRLREIARKHKTDLILSHYGPIAIKVANAFKKSGIKHIACFHGFDLSRKLSEKRYVKHLLSSNEYIDASFVPSEFLKSKLTEIGFSDKTIFKIPYGIDLTKINDSDKIQFADSKVRILHVGRLIPKKGVLDLIDMVDELSIKNSIEFIIIGDGSEMQLVKEKITRKKLDAVIRLLGEQPHEVVFLYMKSCDIYVLNSRIDSNDETEGFPNTILEAMASGCAVISTLHAGIPEAIEHEKDGILVNENDVDQLKKELIQLIENKSKREKLAKNAEKKGQEKFGVEKMQELIQNAVNQIMDR